MITIQKMATTKMEERNNKLNSLLMFCTAAPAATSQSGMGMFIPLLLILGIFYFMLVRPQQRKEKERRKMIDELRAGKKVIFAGGLMGKIVEAKEKTFKIEIAGDVVIEVARAAVQTVVEETPETK